MTVVADSSPLISLARIRKLGLLQAMFQRILIPPEVHREVAEGDRPGASDIQSAAWIEVAGGTFERDPEVARMCSGLGPGEAASILLAKFLRADLILLDEARARRVARQAGLQMTGCLGLLEAATRAGAIADLRSDYVELLRQGIWFDLKLLNQSLDRFGLLPL